MKIKTFHNTIIIFLAGGVALIAFIFFDTLQKNRQHGISLDSYSASVANGLDSTESIALREVARIEDSEDTSLWLNSGALYYRHKDYSRTLFGELPAYSRWRIVYNSTNPMDTDKGYHPQNIFRLITKNAYLDVSQQFYFMVVRDNLSQSPNRNESNGVFAISRFIDGDNLYYAGVRVDGTAVIKKKINGIYHTLAQVPFFDGDPYDKNIHPSLIPKNKWVGIRVDIKNISDNTVDIKLFADKNNDSVWSRILEVKDSHQTHIPALLQEGHGGIRSDFMDIQIRNHSISVI